ncbi:MAG: SRPBCC family protein [Jiangellales bacterium]
MRVEASVVIHRPRAEVWQYLTTPGNAPDYWVSMESYEATSPLPLREGSTMAGKMRHGPTRVDLNQVVTRSVEDHVLEWTDMNEHLPTAQAFTLSEADGGTRVIYRSEGTAKTLVGRVSDPVLTYLTHRDTWTSLDRLKELLEGPQSQA